MKRSNPVSLGLGLVAVSLGACANVPTLESIKYGYSPSQAFVAVQEEPIQDDYHNDMAAGWAPEARPEEQRPTEYGFDGTPVGSSLPDRVTPTKRPINDGVDQAPQGTRNLLPDLYAENQKEVERLTTANEDPPSPSRWRRRAPRTSSSS